MYWFVIYAARSQTRSRCEAPHVGPPAPGNWLACGPPVAGDRSIARFTAILTEREWVELCSEQGLDLEQACRVEGRCTVCEAGPLPVITAAHESVELPGVEAVTHDSRKRIVGPIAAIALELPRQPGASGAATGLQTGICVAPLPASDGERERAHSLFSLVAFDLGGSEVELRCPECASPELRWLGGSDLEQQMGCGNCGARLAREAAFLRLGDCEQILATAPPPALAAASAAP